MSPESQSIRELLQEGWMRLEHNSVPNARRNAEWMLASALRCSVLDLFADSHRAAAADGADRYRRFLARRTAREPLQYITGDTAFMSLPFRIRPGVFVPRPDTEVLVEKMEDKLKKYFRDIRVLDLCCGAGVIGISLAVRSPHCRVTGVDASMEAVRLSQENARLNGVSQRAQFVHATADDYGSGEKSLFTAVVCNPPYIASGDIPLLPPEVKDHEPMDALDGGADGLDFYRRVIPRLPAWIQRGGYAAFEIGASQKDAVIALLLDAAFDEAESYRDYSGNDRVVLARRPMQFAANSSRR
ncbi:MAG: peptide chain release factor N(5)-glutamine methyltransferase [Candidatus Latescibacterota bacterium]